MLPLLMLPVLMLGSADVKARLDLDPLQVEIGQPVTVVLTVSHPRGVEVELPADDKLVPDDTWVFLDALGRLTTKDPDAPERSISFARWEVASLEPGERTFPFPDVRWTDGSSAGYASVEAPTVTVGAALAEGEDVARGPRGFRDPELPAGGRSLLPWIVGGGVVLLIASIFFLRRKPTSARAIAAERSPRERLDGLARAEEPEHVRATYFELSKLLREVCDRALGESGEGKTDDEWLDALRERDGFPDELTGELGDLIARCEEVKYGGSAPTQWALEEALKSAREIATRVEQHAHAKETAA